MFPSFRVPLPAFALALLACMALPAAASAGNHQHDLNFDKQEIFKEVPTGGGITSFYAGCGTDYYVLSGSVRVDSVPGGVLSDLDVRTSAPAGNGSPTAPSQWYFEVVNNVRSGQAAQIKLMISCIKTVTTGGSGSQHTLSFAPRVDGGISVPARIGIDFNTNPACGAAAAADPFAFVPTGAGTVVDPGSAARRLIGIEPDVKQVGNKWFPTSTMNFHAGAGANDPQVNLYTTLWCLNHKTSFAQDGSSNHQHYLDVSQQIVTTTISRSSGNSPFRQAVYCPSGTYAIAPTYYIPYAGVQSGIRLVGIGYQGDQDVFSFLNPGGNVSQVDVGVLCMGKKTGDSTGLPSPGAGPGRQKLLTSERAKTISIPAGKTAKTTLGCVTKTDFVTAGTLSGSGAGAVQVVRSGGGADVAKWPFTLRNRGGKSASVTLNVKCLAPWAEGHTLVVAGEPSSAPDGVDSCSAGAVAIRPTTVGSDHTVMCLSRKTTKRINHYHDLVFASRSGSVAAGKTTTLSCPAGYAALVPKATLGKGAKLAGSTPKGRSWAFAVTGGGAKVSVTCLRTGTTPEMVVPVKASITQ